MFCDIRISFIQSFCKNFQFSMDFLNFKIEHLSPFYDKMEHLYNVYFTITNIHTKYLVVARGDS